MLAIDICEDNKAQSEGLSRIISEWEKSNKINITINRYEDALSYLSALDLRDENFESILFLDIEIPGMSGIQVKNQLEHSKNNISIVFCSSHREYILDAFGKNVYGFLEKPYEKEDVFKMIDKIHADASKKILTFKSDGKYISINIDEISHIEAGGRYTKLFYSDKAVIYDKGIDSLEEYLSEYGFLRTHRCYLVNYRFIKSISESVHLKNGTAIPMARKRKKIIEEEIRKFILRDMMRY